MLLPHIGTWPLGTYWLRKAMICCSACASVMPDALTLSINPLRPWVPLFQASILSSHSCDWWMTSTGPAMRGSRFGPVTTTAISSKRSVSGVRPVISQSSQTRFWSDFASVHGLGGGVSGMARIVADGLAWVGGLAGGRGLVVDGLAWFDAWAGGRALALVGADLPPAHPWCRVTDHLSVCAGHRSASRRCIACQYAWYWLRDAPCAALRWLRAAYDICSVTRH